MKMIIKRFYASYAHKHIMIDLYDHENDVNAELRLCDAYSRDFMKRYEPFLKWLHNMSDVPMDADTIITAFTKFKNAEIGGSVSCKSDSD